MSAIDSILSRVKEDALILMEDSTDRDVLEAIVAEGTPLVLNYKTRGVIPQPGHMIRIATYLVAMAAAMEQARMNRRAKHERS